MRLDVWLDVACLFRTRSEARTRARGARSPSTRQSAKSNRLVRPGDEIVIGRPFGRKQRVMVKAVAEHHVAQSRGAPVLRGPDAEAYGRGNRDAQDRADVSRGDVAAARARQARAATAASHQGQGVEALVYSGRLPMSRPSLLCPGGNCGYRRLRFRFRSGRLLRRANRSDGCALLGAAVHRLDTLIGRHPPDSSSAFADGLLPA